MTTVHCIDPVIMIMKKMGKYAIYHPLFKNMEWTSSVFHDSASFTPIQVWSTAEAAYNIFSFTVTYSASYNRTWWDSRLCVSVQQLVTHSRPATNLCTFSAVVIIYPSRSLTRWLFRSKPFLIQKRRSTINTSRTIIAARPVILQCNPHPFFNDTTCRVFGVFGIEGCVFSGEVCFP